MKQSMFLLVPMLCLLSNSQLQCGAVVRLLVPEVVHLEVDSFEDVTIALSAPLQENVLITFNVTYSSQEFPIIELPDLVILPCNSVTPVSFPVKGADVGQVTTHLRTNSSHLNRISHIRIRYMVVHSNVLTIISYIIGWIYFFSWAISFYPQVYANWKRKSVVGLSFDFLALNLTGHIAYGVFNICLFCVPYIKAQYIEIHPNGVNPVEANDVFFSIHATLIMSFTTWQCCVYERGMQRVSLPAAGMLISAWLFALITLIVTIAGQLMWLQYLYYFSYIKLAVTVVKYIPQVYLNYQRKSTSGWCIGNVLLDFSGGIFSLLQMLLQSYNNEEWMLIFGDITKFGLGLISMSFDIVFMVQHYCLYSESQKLNDYKLLNGEYSKEYTSQNGAK
uniref:Cystinosin homolog n=1 Tax=Callorhinchus milii TaxID=7868 RepID=V9KDR6_CALMI